MTTRPGRVRTARLTDLAALGELSRLSEAGDGETRSLGLPVSGPPIGVFSLFRLPLGAFRPNDLLFVYEDQRRLAGLVRVEREASRDEWTIVELDAIGLQDAGDIRFRLVQHLLRDGGKRGAMRFHVACADADERVVILQIETRAGIAQAEAIAAVKGVDAILIGPTDLAYDMTGQKFKVTDEVHVALDGLCATLRRVKMPFGMPVNMGDYERFKGRGATLVYYPLYQLVERGLAELRARLGC